MGFVAAIADPDVHWLEVVADLFAEVPSMFANTGGEDEGVWWSAKCGEVAGYEFCNLVREYVKCAARAWRVWFCPEFSDV